MFRIASRVSSTTLRRHCARKYATVSESIPDGPPVTATNRAQATQRRFWRIVSVQKKDDSLLVTLDDRPLKTPSGKPLALPLSKRLLAALVANEWGIQENMIKPHALPLTSLASRVIDGFNDQDTRQGVIDILLKYFDTDAICYHENEPGSLVRLQQEHWSPLIQWANEELKVEVQTFDSVMIGSQPQASKETLRKTLTELDQWQLAGLERAVYTTKSFLIALAFIKGRISVEQAAQAAHVEVNSQIQRWGEVEDSHDVDYQDIRRQLGSISSALLDL